MVDLDVPQTSMASRDGFSTLGDSCLNPITAYEISCGYMTPRDRLGFTATSTVNLKRILYEAGSRVNMFT